MTQVAFSTATRVVVGLAGLLLFGLLAVLVAVFFSLEGTRDEIKSTRAELEQTDRRVQRLSSGFAPILEAVAPIVSKGSRREVRRTARQVTAATAELPGLADDVDGTAGAVGAIAEAVIPAGERLIPRAIALLDALDVPGARSPRVCDERLRSRAPAQAGQVGCLLRLVPNIRALLRTQRSALLESLEVQSTTRDGTGALLELFRQSLEVQRELLVHVRSLDQKSGGTVTPGG